MKRTLPFLLLIVGFLFEAGSVRADDDYPLSDAQKNHWAWKTPVRAPIPVVKDAGWVKSPIDAFVLSKLEAKGLKPAPPADPRTLLRRITFDLVGLPPTPQELADFEAACTTPLARQVALGKAIDRLLASPHYGERWGRHWLDLVRFAESNGYEFDEPRPDAWRYRDYVIASYNADKPYDRFVQEQLAGDELFPGDTQAWIATGLNLLGPDMTDASSQAQRRQNTLDDITDTTGLAFLGMTIGCAHCHDHKFEPIPQTDYFRLQAFFTGAQFRRDAPVASKTELAEFAAGVAAYKEKTRAIDEQIAKVEEPYREKLHAQKLATLSEAAQNALAIPADKRTAAQTDVVLETMPLLKISEKELLGSLSAADKAEHAKLTAELKAFDKLKPKQAAVAMALADGPGPIPKTHVLERGELSNPGAEVRPGFPIVLVKDNRPIEATPPDGKASHRRAALARWLTRPDNPLAARVMVNRLWQHHFGSGIVATANDFGVRGSPPSHPELLDWLAVEFAQPAIGDAWSIKRMHKLLLMSASYQQSTRVSKETLRLDPDNDLFSRMNRQRLEGEIVRDSLLAISGRLNPKMGGRGVFPPVPIEATKGTGYQASPDPADHRRRSVYIFARRNLRFPFLESFDLPDSNQSCPKRGSSVTAPQALALLNAADVVAASKETADRLAKESTSTNDRIQRAYRLILGRAPTADEESLAHDFLSQSPLTELCRALFNVNEFVFVD
jgi:Protein of unknown function (DUF1553)/Protein of unknown function (DUF1549)